MPLKSTSTPAYLKRTRVLVDSNDANASRTKGLFNYTFDVDTEFQNVVSIELVDWNFDNAWGPTFVGRYNTLYPDETLTDLARSTVPGACTFDIRIENEATPPTSALEFTVNMEFVSGGVSLCNAIYSTKANVVAAINTAVTTAFTALGTTFANINSTNTTLSLTLEDSGRMMWTAFRTANPFEPMRVNLLFKSGPTAADQASRAIGFDFGVDAIAPSSTVSTPGIGSGTNFATIGTSQVNPQPFRYVDIEVQQVPEYSPLARVYLAREDEIYSFETARQTGRNARLLSDPIRRLDRLGIKLSMGGDYRITEGNLASHQLTFEILSLAQESDIPEWVAVRLAL